MSELENNHEENMAELENNHEENNQEENINYQNIYQQNINNFLINNQEDIEFKNKVLPYSFLSNYEQLKKYENGTKIVAPIYLLNKISNYENISFPIIIEHKNTKQKFTIHEFLDTIDHIYIPNYYFYKYDFLENNEEDFVILKDNLIPGTLIKLKPHDSKYLEVLNIKYFLEDNLNKYTLFLEENMELTIPYDDSFLKFTVVKCEPKNIISINEVENLSLEFEYIEENITSVNNEENGPNDNKTINSETQEKYFKDFFKNKNIKLNFKLNSK